MKNTSIYKSVVLQQTMDKLNEINDFKGATKFYFMYYSRVIIILVSTGLYKSAFSIYLLLVKLDFHFSLL